MFFVDDMDNLLSKSLNELTQTFQHAIDIGCHVPDEGMILHVKSFLEYLYKLFPQRYYIYVDSGGGIYIYLNNYSNNNWVSIAFYRNNETVVSSVVNNKHISKTYCEHLHKPNQYILDSVCSVLNANE